MACPCQAAPPGEVIVEADVTMAQRDGELNESRAGAPSRVLVWVVVIHYACSSVPWLWYRDALANGNPGAYFLSASMMMAIVVLLGWRFDAYAPLKSSPAELTFRQASAVLCFQGWAIAFSVLLALVLWGKPFTLNHLTYWFVIFSVFFATTLPWFLNIGRQHQAASSGANPTSIGML